METPGRVYIHHARKADWLRFWFLGDLHRFTRAHDIERLERDIAFIRDDPISWWVGMGDYNECMALSDYRMELALADPHKKEMSAMQVYEDLAHNIQDDLVDLFSPIKNKCLGLLMGNHEKKFMQTFICGGMMKRVCDRLGVRYLHYSAKFEIVSKRDRKHTRPFWTPEYHGQVSSRQIRLFVAHGAGGSRTKSGRRTKLQNVMRIHPDCDVVALGHMHDRDELVRSVPVLGPNGKGMAERQQVGLITGSYYRTYVEGATTYAEGMDMEPVNLGMHGVQVKFEHGRKSEVLIEPISYYSTVEAAAD